ncbi:MAG: hypothetical protein IPM64_04530 [Phycisphaerales bacterium]|nr:hypothetical protein [Phycisphaerales bacterium]
MNRLSPFTCAMILALVAAAHAEQFYAHERVVVQGRYYYLRQQPLNPAIFNPRDLHARARPGGGIHLIYADFSSWPLRDLYMKAFDSWGNVITPDSWCLEADYHDISLSLLVLDDQVWIAWSDAQATWAQRFATDGEGPIEPRFVLDDQMQSTEEISLASNGSIVVAGFSSWDDGTPPWGALLRYYDLNGNPLTELTTIAGSTGATHYSNTKCAVAPNGDTMVSYTRALPSGAGFNRHGSLSGGFGAPQPMLAPDNTGWPHALEDGGFLVKSGSGEPLLSAHWQRFEPDGTPVAWRAVSSTLGGGFAANRRGEFVQYYRRESIYEPPTCEFFDANLNLVSERIPVSRTGPNPTQVAIAFPGDWATVLEDDGTFWCMWTIDPRETHVTMLKPFTPGDLDGDGRLTNFDIDPFVLALTNREAYQAAFPHIPPEAIDILGDMNGDGVLTNFDIDPFVDALVNGP